MNKYLLFLLISLGCAYHMNRFEQRYKFEKYKVHHNYDEFDKNEYWIMFNNFIKCENSWDLVSLTASKQICSDGSTLYFLNIIYESYDWIFIEPGESLVLLVDGERHAFTGEGSQYRRNFHGSYIEELANYNVNLSDLSLIAEAQEIKIKLCGNENYIVGQFTERNFKNFKHFLTNYCL